MKLIKTILSLIIIFLLLVVGISAYLGPDSLRFCPPSPVANATGNCAKVDAIVAISGGDTIARTDEAIKLYKAGWADTLIFSGAAADKSGPSNAAVMQRHAINQGVDPTAITLEDQSNSTDQNARYVMDIVKARGYRSIILVTSAYHERRALLQFQHYAPLINGVRTAVVPHPVAHDKDWTRYWWLTPWGWTLATSEIAKSVIVATGGVDVSG